jgi:hypothetical protein
MTAEQLERFRQAVMNLGRAAYSDDTAPSGWPGEF